MTRRRVAGAVATSLIAFALPSFAPSNAQTRPARDPNGTPTGSAILSGQVVSDDASSRPIRQAAVVLSSGELRFPQSTMTDDAGRFVFAGLAAGNYAIVGTKPGYVAAFYGGKQPGRGPGVPIAVLEGQQITDVTLKMLHGAAITGVVTTASGGPAQGVNVQVFQLSNVGGVRRISLTPAIATTDDLGVYRAFGLGPGEYVLQVSSTFAMLGLAAESRLVTPAELRWADQAALAGAAAAPPAAGQTVSYSSVYYPGTPDLTSASVITLGPAEERRGVDLALSFVPTARVTGQVVDANGRPVQAIVSMMSRGVAQDIISLLGVPRSSSPSGPDGYFAIKGVTPGAYTVSVRVAAPNAGGGQRGQQDAAMLAAARLLGGSAGGTPMSWASVDVSVEGRDVSDVVLRLQPGMTVSGRLVFESATAQPPDVTRARLALMPPPAGSSALELTAAMLTGTFQATIAADGTFTVRGVAPSKYRVTTGGLGMLMGARGTVAAGWTLKSAMLGGRDVADVPFDVRPNEDVADLVVTLTDHPAELAGTVTDRAGRPAPGFPIVVFSTDRVYWTVGSRRVQQVRPSSDGKYKLTGLPAGEYYVCALTDLDQNQLYDPAFLESLLSGSFKITLADGEKKTQDLKLAGGS